VSWYRARALGITVGRMGEDGGFDPAFDFRSEGGDDPDSDSPTLREYHRRLWSKPLPNGDPFELEITFDKRRRRYFLHHPSLRDESYLTSDSAMQTWTRPGWQRWMRKITEQVPESDLKEFLTIAHQIGGKVLFPGMEINGRTINQERGTNPKIRDRFDLTLECIRLRYLGEDSPLDEVLRRYWAFFELFVDFKGYTDFFLLQDLVSDGSSAVKFLIPFADFTTSPFPDDVEAYQEYRRNGIRFIEARNRRMADQVPRSRQAGSRR